MKLYFIHFLFILNLLFSAEAIPPSTHAKWVVLQDYPIWIGWTEYNESNWCKTKIILHSSVKEISTIIEDKGNYPNVFKRVESATIITDNIVHIILDMPFPFYGRDYIVSYTHLKENNDIVYMFTTVENSGVPIHKDYVRLIHAAGEWRLHSIDSNSTEVTYIWNGELLGDFPDWALTRAWQTQGQEVMTWLKEAIQN